MKKRAIIWIIVLVLILIAGGFFFLNKNYNSSKAYAPDEQMDYIGESTTIIHKDFKAIINADWQEIEIPPSNFVYLPPNTSQEDINAEFISIISTYLGEENQFTLEGLLEQGIGSSKLIMPDFELTENISWENENLIGKKIKFTGTQNGIKRNYVQVFGIKYNNLYAITYLCPNDSCNSYAIYNGLIESFEPVEAKKS